MAILNSIMGETIPNSNIWEIIRNNNNNYMVGIIRNNSLNRIGGVIQTNNIRAMWSRQPMLMTVGTTRGAALMSPTLGGGQERRLRVRMRGFPDSLTRFVTWTS